MILPVCLNAIRPPPRFYHQARMRLKVAPELPTGPVYDPHALIESFFHSGFARVAAAASIRIFRLASGITLRQIDGGGLGSVQQMASWLWNARLFRIA